MFSWILKRIRNFGVIHAIESLDDLQQPLANHFNASIQKFSELDGNGLSFMVIAELKSFLCHYFDVQLPETNEQKGEIK